MIILIFVTVSNKDPVNPSSFWAVFSKSNEWHRDE